MFVPLVSQSIQKINEAVDSGDAAQTLAALRNPGTGLYGVTSECAQTYQEDLTRIKNEKMKEGEEQIDGWMNKGKDKCIYRYYVDIGISEMKRIAVYVHQCPLLMT